MDRAKALSVLHEILALSNNMLEVYSASLDASSEGYSIKLKCSLDGFVKECLEPVVGKEGLTLSQVGDYVVIK